jgi:hypothetical protein
MPRKLTKLRIDEVSMVDKAANPGAVVMLWKRDATADDVVSPLRKSLQDIFKATAQAMHDRKRRGADQLMEDLSEDDPPRPTKKGNPVPQVDIMKALSFVEEGLLARAKDPKEFAKLYETDIEFRKQWRDLTDAKQLQGYLKSLPGVMSLEPSVVGGKDATDVNNAVAAVKQLQELATSQHKSFEQVMLENPALTARTYTSAHRSSTSGSELQR